MKTLLAMIDVLRNPGCWIQIPIYSAKWDAEVTRLLDSGSRFTDIDHFHATLFPYRVWIANHPYASIENGGCRPRRATILRAGRMLPATSAPDQWEPKLVQMADRGTR